MCSGVHTLLAPNDEAFTANQPPPEDDGEPFLQRYLLRGAQKTFDLERLREVKTGSGDVLAVSEKQGELKIGRSRVLRGDITCTNGVIHVIDGLP